MPPTATPLPSPTPAGPALAVLDEAGEVQVIPLTLPLDALTRIGGLLPRAGSDGNGVYFIRSTAGGAQAVRANGAGSTDLPFIQNLFTGLSVWPGDQVRLAWNTFADDASGVWLSSADGVNIITVAQAPLSPTLPSHFAVGPFSADGQALYFSREPFGIGGYILFAGASSLYRFDLISLQTTELIPFNFNTKFLCLDDLSPDASRLAHHCDEDRDHFHLLEVGTRGNVADVYFPTELVGVANAWGSARFNGDGTRVAYALAKNNPEAEQGWVAVGDKLEAGGQSRLIATSVEGDFFTVLGWLNADTVLAQSAFPQPAVWALNAATGEGVQLSSGQFLSLVE
jgi:hypothetical protein